MARDYTLPDPMEIAGYELDPISGDIINNLDLEALDDSDLQLSLGNSNLFDIKDEVLKPQSSEPREPGDGPYQEADYSWSPEARTAANNYGYMNKPGFMDIAKMAPGPIGMAAKAVNAAYSLENAAAKNAARAAMGLEKKDAVGQAIKGTFSRDDKGKVADVSINGRNYSVGLEALDKQGRTTLTPEEARMRGMMSPTGLTELNKDQAKQAQKDFKAEQKLDNTVSLANVNTNPVTPDVPEETDPIAQGLGLMGVSPSFRDAVETKGTTGQLKDAANFGLSEKAQNMAETMSRMGYGDLGVNSGYRSPSTNANAGGAKSSQHMRGNAMDLATRNLTDLQKAEVLDAAMVGGAKGIGTYNSGAIHVDVRDNPASWGPQGYTGTNVFAGAPMESMPSWSRDNLQALQDAQGHQYLSMYGPTPEARPEPNIGLMSSLPGAATGIQNTNISSLSATPSSLQVTEDDKKLAAQTLAGEIDLSKTDLSTEEGRKEAYGIMSTMENRAEKYGGLANAINAPNQYSTWNNASAAATATKNYDLNPEMYDSLVSGYFSDPNNNLGFTSYHANNVNPSWSGVMDNPTTLGAHTFGSLPEYSVSTPESFAVSNPPTPESRPDPSTAGIGVAGGNISGVMDSPDPSQSNTNTTDTTNSTSQSSQGSQGNQGNQGGDGSDQSDHASDTSGKDNDNDKA